MTDPTPSQKCEQPPPPAAQQSEALSMPIERTHQSPDAKADLPDISSARKADITSDLFFRHVLKMGTVKSDSFSICGEFKCISCSCHLQHNTAAVNKNFMGDNCMASA